jgi:esterase/lipase superfamily enzyme
MTTRRKRLLWGASLVIVLLLGLAIYTYFVGTRTLLEHAEAFSFRRLTVSRLADTESFRFFYVTNRQLDVVEDSIDERYTSAREAALKFGSFDTRIEPSLGLGLLIDPSAWFLNEEIQLQQVRSLAQADFLAQLREQVEASPRRSLLVVVHGFRERYSSALRKTAFLSHVLDIDTPVMVFDWPGDQGSSLRGYQRARGVARASGSELAETLKLILQEIDPDRLWLMANSMGGQVVVDAFARLNTDPGLSDLEAEIENVILTAPDVDHEEFNNDFKNEIKALAGNVTVYVSSNDRALLVSRLVNREARSGESTLGPDQLEEASRVADLMEPGERVISLVDVTPVNRTRNFHNFSLETPEYFDDLFLRLSNETPPRSRLLYQIETPDGRVYSVLTRGR